MLNRGILASVGGSRSRQFIGVPGEQGFGVGIYGGDPADLEAIGLSPIEGCEDPASPNYGNYIHKNGSVMVYIPAFVYRIGQPSAPSFARDGANALEVRDALEAGAPVGSTDMSWSPGNGWVLHRAFLDGGRIKHGFFIDKYLCSKSASDANVAVSVRDANQISLSSSLGIESSSSIPGCVGYIYDAITLSRARGEAYACVSAFQWSALSMLSLAHGQAATDSQFCGWYDANYEINFPKGCNNGSLGDVNDSAVIYQRHSRNYSFCRTGSGVPFEKVTHNGQVSGVADVNGCMQHPLLGIYNDGDGVCRVAKESYRMHDFDKTNYNTQSNFDQATGVGGNRGALTWRWGSGAEGVFWHDSTGPGRAMCGVYPSKNGASEQGTSLFGSDSADQRGDSIGVVVAGGYYGQRVYAGIWNRSGSSYHWDKSSNNTMSVGFRVAGYAN